MNFAHSEVATLDPNTMRTLCEEYVANNYIDPETSERLGVKRGLRNPDGTGVLAGLTNVCDVVGYKKDQEGHVIPTPGKLKELFEFSLEEVEEAGWNLEASTFDLHHNEEMVQGNVMTEYEEKFSSMGNPICKMVISRECHR